MCRGSCDPRYGAQEGPPRLVGGSLGLTRDVDARSVSRKPFAVRHGPHVGSQHGQFLGRNVNHTVRAEEVAAESPLANRAVPPVGRTCDGPAA